MPKKLIYPKEVKIASIKLEWINFQVIAKMNQKEPGKILYYQVQCRRKKISNHSDKELAIRRMFAEANYELQDMFKLQQYKNKSIYLDWQDATMKYQNEQKIKHFASVRDTGEPIQGTKLK